MGSHNNWFICEIKRSDKKIEKISIHEIAIVIAQHACLETDR